MSNQHKAHSSSTQKKPIFHFQVLDMIQSVMSQTVHCVLIIGALCIGAVYIGQRQISWVVALENIKSTNQQDTHNSATQNKVNLPLPMAVCHVLELMQSVASQTVHCALVKDCTLCTVHWSTPHILGRCWASGICLVLLRASNKKAGGGNLGGSFYKRLGKI